MTKAEYIVNLRYCYIRCSPKEDNCKNCQYLKIFKEICESNPELSDIEYQIERKNSEVLYSLEN